MSNFRGAVLTGKLTEKELKRLIAITTIQHNIGANLDPEEISRIAIRDLLTIFDCDGCAILLIEGDNVRILSERGFLKALGGTDLTTNMPAIRYIMKTKAPIFTGDIQQSPASSCIPHGCAMNSLICTPIMVNDEVKGIIHLDSMQKNAFSEETLEFANLLAKELSIAIERSLLYSKVQDLAIRDGLTGCFNRRKFDIDIVAEISSAKLRKKPLSLLIADIDWFKKYNDFHGHPKGDILLQQFVSVLVTSTRPLDNIYRYGGEEFAILLTNTNKEQALPVAIRLQKAVEMKQFKGEEKSQPNKKITVSIGGASFPTDASSADELIKAADSALYKAKNSGRNRAHIFNKGK